MQGLRLAVGTLTAVPVPAPRRVDRAVARTAMLLAPVVGVGLGVAVAGLGVVASAVGLDEVVGVAVVGGLALLTRGLHLDGLADTADGLASGPGRALDVMRRGDVGPVGVATLVLVLLAQSALVANVAPGAVVLAVVASRATLPLLCSPPWRPARPDGLGAGVLGTVPLPASLACLGVVAVAGAAWGWSGWGPSPGVAVGAVVAATAAAAVVAGQAQRQLGGLTGDVLGASVEAGMLAALLVLAA